jgi:hypothetical protein
MSFSQSWVETFSITHARELASRIASDLLLMSTYYNGYPSREYIERLLEEIAQYLAAGYLSSFEIGFQRGDRERVFTLLYEALADGTLSGNRAGGVPAYEDVSDATPFNYLVTNSRFAELSADEQAAFEAGLPVRRASAPPPRDGNGYWTDDRYYGAGGVSLRRKRFVSYD